MATHLRSPTSTLRPVVPRFLRPLVPSPLNLIIASIGSMLCLCSASVSAISPLDIVLDQEARRIEMIDRVSPSVVCVFDATRRGGGSGVLIDEDGYGLTNYHVVAGLLDTRKGWGGLGDGVLYELEVLGIDVTGDVAMFRLIPPKDGYKFPFARLGDSDAVSVGDPAIAMGNPFILSEDYLPSVTLGLITGTKRYQWGVKGNLTYTNCIQVDASINPGNSGGPLFNESGEVIGINGRISVSTRGRFNVGFGYAISSNQIKRFMPALRAGLLARHGSWQATVEKTPDGIVFARLKEPGPAFDAGIRRGDRLIAFDNVPIETTNQVASLLGTYPENWPIALDVERDGRPRRVVLRLDPVQPKMKRPFEVERDVNTRQVRRVLDSYRRASRTPESVSIPTTWKWTVRREFDATPDGTTQQAQRYAADWTKGESVNMRQLHEDGSSGRLIEYDDLIAEQRTSSAAEAFELPIQDRMASQALYRLKRWLVGDDDTLEVTELTLAGGDALWSSTVQAAGTKIERGASPSMTPRIVEIIEAQLGAHTTARFGFDLESGLAVTVKVSDELSGFSIEMTLSDHRDVGGARWPTTIVVGGDGTGYRDTLSDWELSP